jgi:hypothetical protein
MSSTSQDKGKMPASPEPTPNNAAKAKPLYVGLESTPNNAAKAKYIHLDSYTGKRELLKLKGGLEDL